MICVYRDEPDGHALKVGFGGPVMNMGPIMDTAAPDVSFPMDAFHF